MAVITGLFITPGGPIRPPQRLGTTTHVVSCAFGWINARRLTEAARDNTAATAGKYKPLIHNEAGRAPTI
jgi:hypothetical protein